MEDRGRKMKESELIVDELYVHTKTGYIGYYKKTCVGYIHFAPCKGSIDLSSQYVWGIGKEVLKEVEPLIVPHPYTGRKVRIKNEKDEWEEGIFVCEYKGKCYIEFFPFSLIGYDRWEIIETNDARVKKILKKHFDSGFFDDVVKEIDAVYQY